MIRVDALHDVVSIFCAYRFRITLQRDAELHAASTLRVTKRFSAVSLTPRL